MNIWVHRPSRSVWCVLSKATGGRNIFLCDDWTPGNEPVHLLTMHPHNSCPACETELAAAVPELVSDDVTEPRAVCDGVYVKIVEVGQ